VALNVAWLLRSDGKTFVELETAHQRLEKRQVTLGISDGIWVEAKSGVAAGQRVKQQEQSGTPAGK
jgi:HlyD family secretion protein